MSGNVAHRVAGALLAGVVGLGLLVSAPAEAACTVITGVTVHTPEGPQKGRSVVIDGPRVAAVGVGLRDLKLTLDERQQVTGAAWRGTECAFVQGGSKQLTAGLVAVPTQLGLVEVGLERGTRDDDPQTDDPIRAALVVADGYDPRLTAIAVSRMEGITTALTAPGGGFVSGRAAMVSLRGTRQSESLLDANAAMVMRVPTASFADGLRQIRELVSEVQAWSRDRGAYDDGRPFPEGAGRADLEALLPVVRGQMPVLIGADRASELEGLVRLKQETGLKLVITGAAEGWMVADELARAKIPVIVDPLVYGPGSFDERAGRADNAKLLVEAGVQVMLTAGYYGAHNVRVLRQAAGNAVRGGLDHAAAVAAITSVPAQVFGQRDRGFVGVGAAADLALWSGDPLELSTSLEQLWIGGENIPRTSRQRKLAERYRALGERPGTPAVLPLEPPSDQEASP